MFQMVVTSSILLIKFLLFRGHLMKLFFDTDGKVNYDKISKNTTVNDLLDAIDIFIENNPLPCDNCEESCCKKNWAVEIDNICVNRLSNWDDSLSVNFVNEKLVKQKNYSKEFDQYVLKKEKDCNFITKSNLCTIYEERPIICRLYICSDKSNRYNMLRELIGSTFLKALVLENKIKNNNFTQKTINKYKKNPAVFAHDYNILIDDIFNYSEDEGWLYLDEKWELYQKI